MNGNGNTNGKSHCNGKTNGKGSLIDLADRPLNIKQQRFVEEYLIDFNGLQAAIRAGYSEKAAKEIASRLLTYANIQKAIQEKTRKTLAKVELTREHIIQGLIRETSLIVKQTDKNGRVIAEQKTTSPARVKAWELLGKNMGMFLDRLQIEAGEDTLPRIEIVTQNQPVINQQFNVQQAVITTPKPTNGNGNGKHE